jgi:hypothetical protein
MGASLTAGGNSTQAFYRTAHFPSTIRAWQSNIALEILGRSRE